MKKYLFFLLALYFYPVYLLAQTAEQTFGWNDAAFNQGTKRRVHILFNLDKTTLYGSEDGIILDTIVGFLSKNPHLRIEVDVHTDPQGYPQHNMILSQGRADAVRDTLIAKGINPERIIAKGWGSTKPLYSSNNITKMKTKDGGPNDGPPNYLTDRRVEITIYETNYNLNFNWRDTSFVLESQKRLPIYYTLDKIGLTEESKLTLDTLAGFLKKNKRLKIEFAVHTDQQGQPIHNMRLSEAKALNCADVLIYKGIDSARITPKGYGDTKLLIPTRDIERMKTKEEKQAAYARNRRTVVTIIGK